jgi:hypothetical protein
MLKCVVALTTPRRSFRSLVPVEHIALVQHCRRVGTTTWANVSYASEELSIVPATPLMCWHKE